MFFGFLERNGGLTKPPGTRRTEPHEPVLQRGANCAGNSGKSARGSSRQAHPPWSRHGQAPAVLRACRTDSGTTSSGLGHVEATTGRVWGRDAQTVDQVAELAERLGFFPRCRCMATVDNMVVLLCSTPTCMACICSIPNKCGRSAPHRSAHVILQQDAGGRSV
jgi:hypothetical protein